MTLTISEFDKCEMVVNSEIDLRDEKTSHVSEKIIVASEKLRGWHFHRCLLIAPVIEAISVENCILVADSLRLSVASGEIRTSCEIEFLRHILEPDKGITLDKINRLLSGKGLAPLPRLYGHEEITSASVANTKASTDLESVVAKAIAKAISAILGNDSQIKDLKSTIANASAAVSSATTPAAPAAPAITSTTTTSVTPVAASATASTADSEIAGLKDLVATQNKELARLTRELKRAQQAARAGDVFRSIDELFLISDPDEFVMELINISKHWMSDDESAAKWLAGLISTISTGAPAPDEMTEAFVRKASVFNSDIVDHMVAALKARMASEFAGTSVVKSMLAA